MAAEPPPRPNIVVLLADDLGWREVGYHGAPFATPNIDRLATAGARLERFYAETACTPSRAALMTGRYPMRYGLSVWVIHPASRWGLPREERTIAEGLRDAGYQTAIVGKWHLGHADPSFLPQNRGFERQYGCYVWGVDYMTHTTDGALDWHRDGKPLVEKGYATDLIADEATRLIRERDPKRPLFLYVPFTAPHQPLQAPPDTIHWYDRLRPLDPRRIRAAMIERLDEAVGKVTRAIDEAGMTKDTLVLFLNDNGGDLDSAADNGPLRGGKAGLYEGGLRVPAVAVWPGRIKPGGVVEAPLHMVDLFPTLMGLAGGRLDQPLPLDGRDAWPSLSAGAPSPHDDLLLGWTPNFAALLKGDWKLSIDKKRPDELFNLKEDPGETRNRAAEFPQIAAELKARLEAYGRQSVPPKASDADLVPVKNPPKVWGD